MFSANELQKHITRLRHQSKTVRKLRKIFQPPTGNFCMCVVYAEMNISVVITMFPIVYSQTTPATPLALATVRGRHFENLHIFIAMLHGRHKDKEGLI